MTKAFKVAQILYELAGDDCSRHVMVARDAECWQVMRNRNELFPPQWQVGDVIEVEMHFVRPSIGNEPFLAPNWDTVGVANAIKYDLSEPATAVMATWGESYIDQHSPPPQVTFAAADFVSSAEMSAEEKAAIATQFVQFCRSNFQIEQFTAPLHSALVQLFSFEAFLNTRGNKTEGRCWLHNRWFTTATKRLFFFRAIAESDTCDDVDPGLSDLKRTMRAYVIQRVMPIVSATNQNAKAVRERGLLRQLLRRYGLPDDFRLPRQE